jgi:hypothetical protein
MEKAPIRDRRNLPNSSKKINYIAPEEIEEAIILVVTDSIGIPQEEAISEVARILGYTRTSEKIREYIKNSVTRLLLDGRLKQHNHNLVLPN